MPQIELLTGNVQSVEIVRQVHIGQVFKSGIRNLVEDIL